LRVTSLVLVSLVGRRHRYIEPGSPWQEPYIGSFNGRVRDELLDTEHFSWLAEAQVVIGDWCEDQKPGRPHSALACSHPPRSPLNGRAGAVDPLAA
jgi:hypothetical protein